jgi:hypothetical protein
MQLLVVSSTHQPSIKLVHKNEELVVSLHSLSDKSLHSLLIGFKQFCFKLVRSKQLFKSNGFRHNYADIVVHSKEILFLHKVLSIVVHNYLILAKMQKF